MGICSSHEYSVEIKFTKQFLPGVLSLKMCKYSLTGTGIESIAQGGVAAQQKNGGFFSKLGEA